MAGEKRTKDQEESLSKESVVIVDIEGTTTSITFVKETLFPYVRENLKKYVDTKWDDTEFRGDLEKLKEQANKDKEAKTEGFVPISEDNEKESVVKNVLWQMDGDRKTGALKQLQGHMWREAYNSGAIKGHVYKDVPECLESWTNAGKKVFVYSSGSVEAQKLLFAHTTHGDLSKYFTGHFDTEVGAKQEAASYKKILSEIKTEGSDVIFITDVLKEATAAKEAGISPVIITREGNTPISAEDAAGFTLIKSFHDLTFQNSAKRQKLEVAKSKEKETPKETKSEKENVDEKMEVSEDVEMTDVSEKEKTVDKNARSETTEKKENKSDDAVADSCAAKDEAMETDGKAEASATAEKIVETASSVGENAVASEKKIDDDKKVESDQKLDNDKKLENDKKICETKNASEKKSSEKKSSEETKLSEEKKLNEEKKSGENEKLNEAKESNEEKNSSEECKLGGGKKSEVEKMAEEESSKESTETVKSKKSNVDETDKAATSVKASEISERRIEPSKEKVTNEVHKDADEPMEQVPEAAPTSDSKSDKSEQLKETKTAVNENKKTEVAKEIIESETETKTVEPTQESCSKEKVAPAISAPSKPEETMKPDEKVVDSVEAATAKKVDEKIVAAASERITENGSTGSSESSVKTNAEVTKDCPTSTTTAKTDSQSETKKTDVASVEKVEEAKEAEKKSDEKKVDASNESESKVDAVKGADDRETEKGTSNDKKTTDTASEATATSMKTEAATTESASTETTTTAVEPLKKVNGTTQNGDAAKPDVTAKAHTNGINEESTSDVGEKTNVDASSQKRDAEPSSDASSESIKVKKVVDSSAADGAGEPDVVPPVAVAATS